MGEKDGEKEAPNPQSNHRRVFTNASQSYGTLTVKILWAENLPGKKWIQPYVQVYLGSSCFHTNRQKGNSIEWNEEFTAEVDRDDSVSFKIWDMVRVERADPVEEVTPLCKKRMPVKDFARRGKLFHEPYAIVMSGGGTLYVEVTLKMHIPVPGEVHTKTFYYPAWMLDSYGVNQIPPDQTSIETGWKAMARYTSRWLLNQRAIQATLQNEVEEVEHLRDEEEANVIPDGLRFQLIDINCSAHDKVHQMTVTYTWSQQEDPVQEQNDEESFTRSRILSFKLFTAPVQLLKKHQQTDARGFSQDLYSEAFNIVREGMEQAIVQARLWSQENSSYEIFKFIPITTPQSHHVLIWYYE